MTTGSIEAKESVGELEISNGQSTPMEYIPDTEEERKLVQKLDMWIVPTVWALYTLSYLDRANIGNAYAAGMGKDLNMNSTHYSIVLLVFFISYIIFEVPSNMLLTRVRPSLYLSALCVLWGAIAAAMAAVQSWQALAAVRFALGVAEAGFSPGVTFYLSSWYKPLELARRYAIYYTATATSGAFSGLLAGVITKFLPNARGIAGWRWLLLIEGVVSCAAGCVSWWFLPDYPQTTMWLSERERNLASARLRASNLGDTQDGSFVPSHLQCFKSVVTNWRVLMFCVIYMLATGAQTIQYFIPVVVGSLGYTGFVKQYMTIPIYMVALLCILAFCFGSDKVKNRPWPLTAAFLLAAFGFIVILGLSVHHEEAAYKKAQYAFLCFAVGGIYAAAALTQMWNSNTITHPSENRSISIAFVNCLGNSASIWGSFCWSAKTAPTYYTGFAVTLAACTCAALLTQVQRITLQRSPYTAPVFTAPIKSAA